MTSARDEARRTSFGRNADRYDAVRPSYPDAIVDAVIARARGPRALELGAGTGKATLPFARRGLAITALEPSPELAILLRRNTAGLAVVVREQRFEDCAETGFDLVLAAQSFHWMDEATRCARAAAAGETLAIVTNDKAPLHPALRDELDAAYARHFPSAFPPRTVDDVRAASTAELDRSGCLEAVETVTHAWRETYTTARYLELLSTYSDHAVHPHSEPLYAEIAAALDRRGGAIEIPYVTLALIARRRRA